MPQYFSFFRQKPADFDSNPDDVLFLACKIILSIEREGKPNGIVSSHRGELFGEEYRSSVIAWWAKKAKKRARVGGVFWTIKQNTNHMLQSARSRLLTIWPDGWKKFLRFFFSFYISKSLYGKQKFIFAVSRPRASVWSFMTAPTSLFDAKRVLILDWT